MVEARTKSSGNETLLSGAMNCARLALSIPDALRQRLAPELPVNLRDDDVSRVAAFAITIGDQLFAHFPDTTASLDHDAAIRRLVLEDNQLLQTLYARALEFRLCRNGKAIGLMTPELPSRIAELIEGARGLASEPAMALVVSQSRFLGNAMAFRLDLSELPSELIAGLVRRTVVLLQDQPGADALQLGRNGEAILSAFDETASRGYRIARFCHIAGWPTAAENWVLQETGPAICFAMLARQVGLSSDFLMSLAIDPALERMAVILRATGENIKVIMRLLLDIAALTGADIEGLVDQIRVEDISIDEARALIVRWRNQLLVENNLLLPYPQWGHA